MKRKLIQHKKTLYWLFGLFGFLLVLNFAGGFWLKNSLPQFIKEKNDTGYQFHFDEIQTSILGNSLIIKGIEIKPNEEEENLKVDLSAEIGSIRISGVNFIKLIFNKDLSASTLEINRAKINYYETDEEKEEPKFKPQFGNSVHISNLKLADTEFSIFKPDRKSLKAKAHQLKIEMGKINFSQETLEKKIPFSYKTFRIESDSLFYQINPSQSIQSKFLSTDNYHFLLEGFKLINDRELTNEDNHRLLPLIQASKVEFSGLDWAFKEQDEFYFHAKSLRFDSIDMEINKRSLQTEKERNFGQLIPFDLVIEKIQIQNSHLKIPKQVDVQNIQVEINQIQNEKDGKLTVNSIEFNQPLVTTFENLTKSTNEKITNRVVFSDWIELKQLKLNDAQFALQSAQNHKNRLQIRDINLNLAEIVFTPETLVNKIPFQYADLKFSAESVSYKPESVYSIDSKKLVFDNGNLELNELKMKPTVSRNEFVKSLKTEKDLYDLSAQQLKINQLDFGFQGEFLYFKTPKVSLNQIEADVFRSKIPPDDKTVKPMYSELLRKIPFILEVKELAIQDSKLVYEEETEKSDGAGKISFHQFNAQIQHIYSGYKRKSTPDVVAHVQTKFMNDANLKVVWSFNPMKRSDEFNIKGGIYNFDGSKMDAFIKPYLHASVSGNIQEVKFDFSGNKYQAGGDFGMKYEDLRVKLYHPKTGKERKVLSKLGNIAVKHNTRGRYDETEIKTVSRLQDRSFFNFFWLCVQQGLKQTVLVI